ncbi:MAG: hypothetical protein ACXIUB_12360 [Wenzhouxiangella sp.]
MAGRSNGSDLWLERESPGAGGRSRRPDWQDRAAGACVFLHGEGVNWARQPGLDAELLICSASWQRRFGQQAPGSGRPASLMVFWARARAEGRVFSRGSPACGRPGQGGDAWLLRYRGDESALARREALELVMAGASLDLDLTVVLEPSAWGAFSDQDWQGWQQLLDHQLANLVCRAGPGDAIPPGLARCPASALDARLSTDRSFCF